MPVARIGHDEAAFAIARDEPIFASDHSRIRAAGDADVRVVLLRSVNVVRERVINRDMIKLRGRLVILRCPGFPAIG